MEDLYGTYCGFMPLNSVAVGLGEMRVQLDDKQLSIVYATGKNIMAAKVQRSSVREMTLQELAVEFDDSASLNDVRGITRIDATPETITSMTRLIFIKAGSDEVEGVYESIVVLRGYLDSAVEAATFTPFLLNPQQVAEGKFNEAIRAIEADFGQTGVIPLINNGGRPSYRNSEN